MRCLLILFAVFALVLPVQAQEAPRPAEPFPQAKRVVQDILLFYGGMGAGICSLVGLGVPLNGVGVPLAIGAPIVVAAYPVAVAYGIHSVGRLIGIEGSFRNTLGDAAIGTTWGWPPAA